MARRAARKLSKPHSIQLAIFNSGASNSPEADFAQALADKILDFRNSGSCHRKLEIWLYAPPSHADSAKARAKRLETPPQTIGACTAPRTYLQAAPAKKFARFAAPDHPAWAFEASSQVNTLDESSYAGRPPRHKLHDLPQVCIPLKTAVGAFHSAKFAFIWSCFGGVKRRYREYFFIRWRNERYEIPSRSAAFVCTPPL